MDIRRSPDAATLAKDAAGLIASAITAVIAERGICHLALAGGSTPAATYSELRQMQIAWQQVHFWFGDERCLPVEDAERNDTMAHDTLLNHLPITPAQIHPIEAELGPALAAERYAAELGRIDGLDIVLLGIGEDGHTASLFPGNAALSLTAAALPVFDSPKPPPERVSLSLATIRAAKSRIILASGASKYPALQQIMAGAPLPAAMVGAAIWCMDAAAFSDKN